MNHPRLVPSFIMQQYEAGQRQGSMAAGSLFVDISGFTTVNNILVQQGSESLEAVADIMYNLWEPLVDAVYAQGGFITGFAGDAFTALFPLDDENALIRMVQTAQTIQHHIAQNPTQSSRYGTFPFAVKLGLDVGQVEWGIIEPTQPELTAAYFFSGPAIDGAAEAEHQAQKGFIVLSKALVEQLGDAIIGQPLKGGAIRLLKSDLPSVEPTPTEIYTPQPATMDVFIPASVQAKQSRGEFRPVISVFVNLMGISTAAQLHIFLQSVFTLQGKYGGYLSSVDFGDKGCNLLLFWGMPTTHANDLDRALSFVLDIPTITPGTFKVGITLRNLYAGFTGSSRRSDYSCYGDGVNLAARLMVEAPWGDVWMEQQVAAKAAAHFQTEDRGAYTLKGFSEPQPVSALLGHREDVAIFHTTFTGREAELQEIRSFIHPIASNREFAGTLVIDGDAGLGKSRLVHEIITTPDFLQDYQVIICQSDELTSQSLGPFRHWLHQYFDQSPEQSDALNKQAFNRKLDQVISRVEDDAIADELNRLRSCLGDLLGLHWDNSLFTQLDPEARQNTVLLALRSLLRAESLMMPLVVVLEDMHAADPISLSFIASLPHRLQNYPVAILITQHPSHYEWDTDVSFIRLQPLSWENIHDIAESVLGGPVEEDIVKLIDSRCDGNPFFAEQILFYLKEADAFALRHDQWHLVKRRTEAPLPYDIRGIFNARLDALPQEIKEVVQVAAILGREFDLHLLTRVTGKTTAMLEPVLEYGEVESIWTSLDDMHYLFQSSLLRDAAYQMQLQSQRRELHLQAARAFEDLYQEEKDDVIEMIAHHYAAAVEQGLTNHREEAIEALRIAGEQAAAVYDNRAAVSHFTRAITLSGDDDQRLIDLYFMREDCLSVLGDRDAQQEDLDALDRMTQQDEHSEMRGKVLHRKAKHQLDIANYDKAFTLAEESLSLAQVTNAPRIELLSIIVMATSCRRQSQFEQALEYLETALSIIEQTDLHHDLRGQIFNLHGLVEAQRGNLMEAQTYLEEALSYYRDANNLTGQYACLSNLGTLRLNHNQYQLSLVLYQQALDIAIKRGSLSGQAAIYNNMAWTSILIGQLDNALAYLDQSLPKAEEIQNSQLVAYGLYNSATAAYLRGDLAQAAERYQQAVNSAEGINLLTLKGDSLVGLGDVALAREEFAVGITHYQGAIAVREQTKQKQMIAEAQTRLAMAYVAQADNAQADEMLNAVETFIHDGGDLSTTDYPIRAYFDLAQLYAVFGQAQAAAEHFANAYRLLDQQVQNLSEPDMRIALRKNITWHQSIMSLWEASQKGDDIVDLLLALVNREEVSERVTDTTLPPLEDDTPPQPEEPPASTAREDDFPEVVAVDADSPSLQQAREHIAFLEGRINTYRELSDQLREDYQQKQHEVKDLARELGRAEATIEMLKQRIEVLERNQ